MPKLTMRAILLRKNEHILIKETIIYYFFVSISNPNCTSMEMSKKSNKNVGKWAKKSGC
jgi:hypothetical protein